MRCRGAILPWVHGAGLHHVQVHGGVLGRVRVGRTYSTQPPPPPPPPRDHVGKAEVVRERAGVALQNLAELGSQWGQKTVTTASATASYWWEKYEEFVGLNEVRDAQTTVTEAEKAFMVARGVVREAHASLEALQVRLKEVRDRLDRVSREEAHYLELATSEHKLLQEERRLRTAYENAEGLEREKFSLFSAGVRESHEKERARAERTKNWSVIGSVLGALIGVMGSTYVNRVRLQELKSLLLEAQKGPVSLQEALRVQAGMHKSQQDELRGLIQTLRVTLSTKAAEDREAKPAPAPAPTPAPAPAPAPLPPPSPSASELALQDLVRGSQRSQTLMEQLGLQLGQLGEGVSRVGAEVETVRAVVERPPPVVEPIIIQPQDSHVLVCSTETVMEGLGQAERRLEARINRTSLYNTVLTYTAFALTVPALYMIFRTS